MADLLPQNSTALERAVAAALADGYDIDPVASRMWNPWTIPVDFLPFLAWAVSVDIWDDAWPVARKREAIAGSFAWHARKGTRGAVQQMLTEIGYPAATIFEDREWPRYGPGPDLILGDDLIVGPSDSHWADFWVWIHAPILYPEADRIAAALADVAPVRCRLRAISRADPYAPVYGQNLILGDGGTLGGTYIYGDTNG